MKELGAKYVCFKCQTRFYDLKKPAPICPKCGADQREQPAVVKTDRKRVVAAPASRLEAVAESDELPAPADDAEEDDEDEAEEDDE